MKEVSERPSSWDNIMEEATANQRVLKNGLPLSWNIGIHNIVDIKGTRTVYHHDNGDFNFEAVVLTLTDTHGRGEEFMIYSGMEGSLTRIPITSTE